MTFPDIPKDISSRRCFEEYCQRYKHFDSETDVPFLPWHFALCLWMVWRRSLSASVVDLARFWALPSVKVSTLSRPVSGGPCRGGVEKITCHGMGYMEEVVTQSNGDTETCLLR